MRYASSCGYHAKACRLILVMACLGMANCHGPDLNHQAFTSLDKVLKLETCDKVKQENLHVEYYPTSEGEYLLVLSKTFSFQFLVHSDQVFGLNADTVDCFRVKPLYKDTEMMRKVLLEVSQSVVQNPDNRRVIIELKAGGKPGTLPY